MSSAIESELRAEQLEIHPVGQHLVVKPFKPFGPEVDEIEFLRSENAFLKETILGLETDLEKINSKMKAIEAWQETYAKDMAFAAKRITKLENTNACPKNTSNKTEEHFKHLISILKVTEYNRATVKFLSARLNLSKRRTWQIVLELEKSGTVNVVWDPHHKKRKLVELKKQFG